MEILLALMVTMIGFAAIFQLQIGNIKGNLAAKELASAVNLGERYAEVLRRDANLWTGLTIPGPHLDQATQQWHSFTPFPVDQNGRAYVDDDANGSPLARQRFCVHYWFEAGAGVYDGILNGRVRVIWPRSSTDRTPLYDVCDEIDAQGFVPSVSQWFTLTVPVTLRRHPG